VATYRDLLDAIARVRSVTGDPDAWKKGLTGDDVTTACNPAGPPDALGAVLAKVTAAHPEVFLSGSTNGPSVPPPRTGEGAAAEAIRDAEAALAHQNTDAAHVDLQVVTAVLNAHAAHEDGLAELVALQRDIEQAVASRTDLDTPAGARQFQRFLIGKLRDIRDVVENSSLDATSKAALAAALAALYASSTPDPQGRAPVEGHQSEPEPAPSEPGRRRAAAAETASGATGPAAPWAPGPDGLSALDLLDPLPPDPDWPDPWLPGPPAPAAAIPAASLPVPPAAAMPAPVMPPPAMSAPPWTGGLPGSAPFGGGLPMLGSPSAPAAPLPELPKPDARRAPAVAEDLSEPKPDPADAPAEVTGDEPGDLPPADGPDTTVDLPDGDTVAASSPELAAAIAAAVGGTPIPEAFAHQGMRIPDPGSPITAPLDPAWLTPGDIGLFTDRHAVALGNGKVLLDNRIQPLAGVSGPGFIGWQHPPQPETTTATPVVPVPNRAAATAPS
jgi:hypothetical protein